MQRLDAVKLRTVMEYKVHVLRKFLHAVGGQCDKQIVFGTPGNY
jgi:hypothetical protein